MDSCIVLIRTQQHGLASGERTVLKFPANSYHMYTVELAFALTSAVNSGVDDRKWDLSPGAMPYWWVLMRTKTGKTAVHDCHCLGDMAMRMSRYWSYHGVGSVCFSTESDIDIHCTITICLINLHQMSEGKTKKSESIAWELTQLCTTFRVFSRFNYFHSNTRTSVKFNVSRVDFWYDGYI